MATKAGRSAAAGFTLLELLVVIAITGIILTLLFAPLIQGFNITRRARAIAVAQDTARSGIASMRRELSQAAFVFDNANAPIWFPMQANNTPNNYRFPANVLPASGPYVPSVLYAKIDFVPAARQLPTGNQVMDPTTGGVLDPATGQTGSNLRFPLAPGSRVVRYFIGLRRNIDANGNKLYYSNPYEFRRTDDDFNPFILYRAEFDPSDPNLINQAAPNDTTADNGGFNDPDFFYNTGAANSVNSAGQKGNGQSYAANWARIAQPVMDAQNLDLLVVRRTATGAIDPSSPIRPTVTFQPSAVTADTATPGFLTNDASELPGAVPTLYTTKYGAWTLPYTVTFYRGSLSSQKVAGTDGQLSVQVMAVQDPADPAKVDLAAVPTVIRGTALPANPFYCSLSRSTGKLFISTPNLTYIIDPERGRIETGLPPLAGVVAAGGVGTPDVLPDGATAATAIRPMTAGTDPAANLGDLVQTVFRMNTRDDFLIAGSATNPQNQGRVNVHLFTNQDDNPTTGNGSNYYLLSSIGTPLTTTTDNGDYPSPRAIFGPALIAAGTERIIGPNSTLSQAAGGNDAVSYFRVPLTAYENTGWTNVVQLTTDAGGNSVYRDFTNPNPGYYFDYDFYPYDMIMFSNDNTPIQDGIPGLAAVIAGAAPQKELRATYYWQNNFARITDANNRVYAIDANGNYANQPPKGAGTASPDPNSFQQMGAVEADVVKVDYSTRALINLNVGARVYDAQSGSPQLVQLSDKIEINNVGR